MKKTKTKGDIVKGSEISEQLARTGYKALDLFVESGSSYAALLTGFLTRPPKENILTLGRLVQSVITNDSIDQLFRELEDVINEIGGDNPFKRKRVAGSFADLLQYIEEDKPDNEVLEGIKLLFAKLISSSENSGEELVIFDLIKKCKKLDAIHFAILKVCYEVHVGGLTVNTASNSFEEWATNVSAQIGLGSIEPVLTRDDELVSAGFLTEKSNIGAIRRGRSYRLTDLGIRLCELVMSD